MVSPTYYLLLALSSSHSKYITAVPVVLTQWRCLLTSHVSHQLTISTHYLFNIYTISSQYLHSTYTISTQYLHTIYTVSTHRDWCVLRDVAGVAHALLPRDALNHGQGDRAADRGDLHTGIVTCSHNSHV